MLDIAIVLAIFLIPLINGSRDVMFLLGTGTIYIYTVTMYLITRNQSPYTVNAYIHAPARK
jgi:hypothetical protein